MKTGTWIAIVIGLEAAVLAAAVDPVLLLLLPAALLVVAIAPFESADVSCSPSRYEAVEHAG